MFLMRDDNKPDRKSEKTDDDSSDTMIVPPPNFRERLEAARRARENEIRPSVQIPLPPRDLPANIDDEDTTPGLSIRRE